MSNIILPEIPALVIKGAKALVLYPDGEFAELSLPELGKLNHKAFLVCHKKAIATALDVKNYHFFDVLELFAFCRPAVFCVPTIKGLAAFLSIPEPQSLEQEALTLVGIASLLIEKFKSLSPKYLLKALNIATMMTNDGWLWGKYLLSNLENHHLKPRKYSDVINHLKEWQDFYREPATDIINITANDARNKLSSILTKADENAENRPEQADYTSAVSNVFAKNDDDKSNIVLAEAGTGVGKTLGYLAPSSLFSEKNQTSVWISTFTKNLQRQIDTEASLIYPEQGRKEYNITIRKGRENYLCLLNFEELCNILHKSPEHSALCGLIARWLEFTRNGDLASGDFPSWLADILGRGKILALTDHRGECLYSACPHYRKCFVEKTLRKAKRSNLVIANHALVMTQGALSGLDDDNSPSYYIFDEGHHLFAATDAAFSAHLTGLETYDLRRWLQGAETGSKSRAKGLKKRLEAVNLPLEAIIIVDEIINISLCLPKSGWLSRITANNPLGETEDLLNIIYKLVNSRNFDDFNEYSIESKIEPLTDELIISAENLSKKYKLLAQKLTLLSKALSEEILKIKDNEESDEITKIESLIRSIKQRASTPLTAFIAMLDVLKGEETPPELVDWLETTKENNNIIDIGMHRHYIDPTKPFADIFGEKAKGVLITSATLKDKTDDNEKNWEVAESLTGARHLKTKTNFLRAAIASPFDYQNQTKIFVVNDIPKNNIKLLANAYAKLFLASGGGSLGIFTSIKRLKASYPIIFEQLNQNHLMLLAQHIDGMDTGTLIDIFRAEENSSLLGTDAVRDGVDVPGRSLRLIVFERVPWQKSNILNKARQKELGKDFNDIQTRMKLSQGFGRLIRKKTDKGVFVLLDSAFPSRLHSAFPKETIIERVDIATACSQIKDFFK